jgi:surface antigen
MALRSLAAITLISFLLTQCTNLETVSETQGTFKNSPNMPAVASNPIYNIPIIAWNMSQYLSFSLDDDEKKFHQSAVLFALMNTNDGEIVDWYSKTHSQVNGKVRVVYSYRVKDGYCRVYQSLITVKGEGRTSTNKACKINNLDWNFSSPV